MDITTIYLDMDGVLCDWVGATCLLFDKDPAQVQAAWDHRGDICPQLCISKTQLWEKVDAAGREFWADLEPYPWMRQLWDACNEIAPVKVLTTPSKNPDSAAGKMEWLATHLGNGRAFDDYHLTRHKEDCSALGRVLIDDRAKVTNAFEAGGGHAILFPRVWNSNRQEAGTPLRYTLQRLQQLQEKTLPPSYTHLDRMWSEAHRASVCRAGDVSRLEERHRRMVLSLRESLMDPQVGNLARIEIQAALRAAGENADLTPRDR